jgi:Domain of unknown function (DUF4345)
MTIWNILGISETIRKSERGGIAMNLRRIQQFLFAVLATILIVRFGLPGLILGGQAVVEPAQVTPMLDSEFRFLSALAIVLAGILIWIIPRVETQTPLVRIIALGTLVGGLARLWSIAQVGMPPQKALIATGIELVLPVIVLLIQYLIARQQPAK